METHNISLLNWASQSPDLNPIENLWDYLDYQIQKRKPLLTSKQELIRIIQEEWANISIEILHNLILSMLRCIKDVIRVKGEHIKY